MTTSTSSTSLKSQLIPEVAELGSARGGFVVHHRGLRRLNGDTVIHKRNENVFLILIYNVCGALSDVTDHNSASLGLKADNQVGGDLGLTFATKQVGNCWWLSSVVAMRILSNKIHPHSSLLDSHIKFILEAIVFIYLDLLSPDHNK